MFDDHVKKKLEQIHALTQRILKINMQLKPEFFSFGIDGQNNWEKWLWSFFFFYTTVVRLLYA